MIIVEFYWYQKKQENNKNNSNDYHTKAIQKCQSALGKRETR